MADNAASQAIQQGGFDARCAPLGLRTLIYPYSRAVHRPSRHLYVDKDYLARIHTLHQVRDLTPGEDKALADYHKALARTKTLSGVALADGQTYEEFQHPCLDETLPYGPCLGDQGRHALLERVGNQTDLKQISRSLEADNPDKARFYMFGLRDSDALEASLKQRATTLDIVFLDLTRGRRQRLGPDWSLRVRKFLEALDRHAGKVATLAITDDPWTFDTLRSESLVPANIGKARRRPATSSIAFCDQPDLVLKGPAPSTEFSRVLRLDALGFSGEIEQALHAVRSSARAAKALNDGPMADTLQRLAGTIRRCASLPASRYDLSNYVQHEVGGGVAAADLLASYRAAPLLAELKQSLGPWAQQNQQAIASLCRSVQTIWHNTSQLTPMAPLLRDVISRYLRVSSRTAVLLRNGMLADFAADALSKDPEIGQQVASRIDKEMLLFLDKDGLDDLAQLRSSERNHIKTLIVVAPTRGHLLALLARPWIPDNLIVLADSDTFSGIARDAARLAGYPELAAITPRMNALAEAAAKAVHRARGSAVTDDEGLGDVEFPASGVVNLAGTIRPGQSTIEIKLSGDQIVIARPGTKLIQLDRSRIIPFFAECEAKDAEIGDSICVIGDAFLEMARPLLNISARAAEEIRDYHRTVLDRLARIEGHTNTDRLTRIVETMNMPGVTVQRARYWVELDEQLDVALHEVVPHAPRDRPTFMAFMAALGVSDAIAARFWTWAVIAQRTSRLRAAISFHDAYRTILIDNYAAQSSNPEHARDIRRLKSAAEDFVGIVEAKRELRGET